MLTDLRLLNAMPLRIAEPAGPHLPSGPSELGLDRTLDRSLSGLPLAVCVCDHCSYCANLISSEDLPVTLKVLMALDGVTDPREGEMNWDLRTREVTYRGAHTGMYLDCTGAPVRPTGEPVATPQRHAAVGQTYERCLRERGGSSV